jgi:hypothetical protein
LKARDTVGLLALLPGGFRDKLNIRVSESFSKGRTTSGAGLREAFFFL